jgi:hypothetical protein
MDAYPLAALWSRLRDDLAAAPPPPPTGVTRELYLDLAEHIVRASVALQDGTGRLLDPYQEGEDVFNTARYVGALGQLLSAGRCGDLVDSLVAAYENLLGRLGEVHHSPEFWVKEMMYAHEALRDHVPGDRLEAWTEVWRGHEGRRGYNCVVRGMTHNFCVFAAHSEFWKQRVVGGGDAGLIAELLAGQRPLFTAHGLYRDPGDPMTYDLVVRQQLDLMRLLGYDGPPRGWLDEVCDRGALTGLLLQSTTGQMPFGGRSNQFHFVEAHFAALCEAQARLCHGRGDELLAGAFKRAGRRALGMVAPWVMGMTPYRQTKQGFDPARQHGLDSGGYYSVYGLLLASLCGTAYHLADESIPEALTPAEVGGYVVALWPEFHKVFATGADYHVQLDTRADPDKDATGLGRLHRAECWPELALSGSIPAAPTYTSTVATPCRALALGPAWRDADGVEHRLADFSAALTAVDLRVLEEGRDGVRFEVTYQGELGGCQVVTEVYELSSRGLRLSCRLEPVPPEAWLVVPVIQTDGEAVADAVADPGGLTVHYRGQCYRLAARAGVVVTAEPPASNRNAVYLTARVPGLEVELRLATAPPG